MIIKILKSPFLRIRLLDPRDSPPFLWNLADKFASLGREGRCASNQLGPDKKRHSGKRHRGRWLVEGRRRKGPVRDAVGTGCCSTRYTYVCTHSAAAGAVTLIAVFSNSKEELLPVQWVRGNARRAERAECAHRFVDGSEKARKKERGSLGEGERGGERYRGLGLITRELTRSISVATSSTWQPA